MLRPFIGKVILNNNLKRQSALAAMDIIMSGKATDAQIAAFLVALRAKGETIDEITGFAELMREKATRINVEDAVLDTCGTGGDKPKTFNISTTAAIIAAGAGVKVAKHGNRAVSSSSGSADVLKELGVNIEATPKTVEKCIDKAGIGFLFAPLFHGAMKHAIGPRREIGIRTVFNILGPLTNPAGAKRQLLGVYAENLTETIAGVLKKLGSTRAMVVHGSDGMDEITTTANTKVSELKSKAVRSYFISPEDFGIRPASLKDLEVTNIKQSAKILQEVLAGKEGPFLDIALFNAAAAVYVAGKAKDLADGLVKARKAVESGAAREAFEKLVKYSNARP